MSCCSLSHAGGLPIHNMPLLLRVTVSSHRHGMFSIPQWMIRMMKTQTSTLNHYFWMRFQSQGFSLYCNDISIGICLTTCWHKLLHFSTIFTFIVIHDVSVLYRYYSLQYERISLWDESELLFGMVMVPWWFVLHVSVRAQYSGDDTVFRVVQTDASRDELQKYKISFWFDIAIF